MDKYTELNQIITKLYAMNEDNKELYEYLLECFKQEKLSFEVAKELAYSVYRGEISEVSQFDVKKDEIVVETPIVEEEPKNIEDEIVYCSKCGAENTYDSTECEECGSIIINHNIAFCSRCGTKNLRMNGRCANCGFIVDDLYSLIYKFQLENGEEVTGIIPKEYDQVLDEYDNGLINHAEAIEKITAAAETRNMNKELINSKNNKNRKFTARNNSSSITGSYISDIKNGRNKNDSGDLRYKCPVCGSTESQFVSVTTQKGVSVGKYFWGGVFFGELGRARALRSGTKSETKIIRKCLNCGCEY